MALQWTRTKTNLSYVLSRDSLGYRRRRRREEGTRSGQSRLCKQVQERKGTRMGRRNGLKKKKGRKGKGGGGAGVALHASHSIRRSRVCPVHVDVSLRASMVGERQELPRA